jgi:hypothetical protein
MSILGDVCRANSGSVCNLSQDFARNAGVALSLQTQTYGATVSNHSPTMG